VIIFDNRGAGQSDKPDMPYTMEMMANDLAALLDAIDIKMASIGGISMGGMIFQHFALQYPKRATSLILGCTSCGGSHAIAPEEEVMAALFDFERMKKMTPQARFTELISVLFSQEFIKNNPGAIQEMAKQMTEHPVNPIGVMWQAEAIKNHDTYERLPENKVPTLIIHGDADRVLPVENARILASRIPHAETVILKGKGHGFNQEAIPKMNQAILNFLEKQS
jgi:pimeloyl-ACP methyl ester carboxylesterase